MKTTRLIYAALIVGCCAVENLQAQNQITGCNGRTYTVGDTLRLGKASYSGYLFVQQQLADGTLQCMNGDLQGKALVIKDIPTYDEKLYQDMAIYEKPEKPAIVMAADQSGQYYINLDPALTHGNIMSEYKQSSVAGYKELTPAVLFVYSMKLYGNPVDANAVDTYLSLCDSEAYERAKQDPFEKEELLGTYKEKLFTAIAAVDYNQVFRLKCLSEAGDYNISQATLSLSGFYPSDVRTDQKSELSKLSYCLWGDCAFHFTNSKEFLSIDCTKERAKSMYNLKKYGTNQYDKTIMLTSYVYVRVQNKPVKLPETRVTVMKPGKSFDFDITTLNKAYGKKSLLMEIVQVDSYQNFITADTDKEVLYNYVGGKSKID